MKKNYRSLHLFALTVAMLVAYAFTTQAQNWTYDSGAKTLTKGADTLRNVTNPSSTHLTIGINSFFSGALDLSTPINGGYTITTIGDWAFYYNTNITALTMPAELISIGSNAFSRCHSLISLDISRCSSLATIGDYAFSEGPTLSGDLKLPASLTTIGSNAFRGCIGLTSLDLSRCNLLTAVGEWAFSGCEKLTSISLPAGLKTIKASAFNGCIGLTGTLSLPTSITTIGQSAFERCTGLTGTLTLPESLTSIGQYAFQGCAGFTAATLPAGLASLGFNPFISCTGLKAFTVATGNKAYKAIGGALFTISGKTLLAYPAAKSGNSYTVPAGVDTIGYYAFQGHPSLSSVILPEGLTIIESGAFGGCTNLTTITLPASLESIYNAAFYGCGKLVSVVCLSATQPDIGGNAFYYGHRALTIYAPNATSGFSANKWDATGVVYSHPVDAEWIYNASVRILTNPDVSTTLFEVTASDNNLSIGGNSSSFRGTTLNLSGRVKSHDGNTTYNITAIKQSAFSGNDSITSLTLPDSLTSIGQWAFNGCTRIATVALPATLTALFSQAFTGCTNLASFSVAAGNTKYTAIDGVLFTADGKTLLAYPNAKGAAYTVPAVTESIGEYAFYQSKVLTTLDLSKCTSLNSIETYAFYECTALTALSFPASLSYIARLAFSSCSGLIALDLTKCTSLRYIRELAFSGCTSLITVDLSKCTSLSTLDNAVFSACTGLTTIALSPSSLGTIEKNVFWNCTSLTAVTLPASVASIGQYAFRDCSSLSSITFLRTTYPSIYYAAFEGGPTARTVYVPNATGGFGTDDENYWGANKVVYGTIPPPVVEERSEGKAVVTWVLKQEAKTYFLHLYADASKSDLIATYEFDEQGRQINTRSTSIQATFNLQGLVGNKTYYVEVEAKNAAGAVVATQYTDLPAFEPSAPVYDVAYNAQGGSAVASDRVESGKHAIAPATPTRTNYLFKGWFKETAYTTEWSFTTDVVTANMTLYAKWEVITRVEQTGGALRIYAATGSVVIENAPLGSIYTIHKLTGATVANDTANSPLHTLPLPVGVYIVRAAGQSVKVAVK